MRLSRTVFMALLNATAASAQKTANTTPDKPTQTGTISTCNKWYDVVSGDTCGIVEQAFSITHAQFIAWNPAVSQDCSQNFWVGEAYCVGIGAGQPVSTTTKPASGLPSPDKPTQTGTASNCNLWYDVVSGDSCTTVEQKFGITHTQFISWNPAVSSDCSANFWIGNSYCVGVGAGVSSTTTTRTASGLPAPDKPTQTGTASNCNLWYDVVSGDSCTTVEQKFGITHAQFIAWNPAISSDCSVNFWIGNSYCVGTGKVASTVSTSTTSLTSQSSISIITPSGTYSALPDRSTTASVSSTDDSWPPTATQSGIAPNCIRWYKVQSSDSCDSIVSRYPSTLTIPILLQWNPGLGSDCSSLWMNYWVCVEAPPTTSIVNATTASQTFPGWTPVFSSTMDVPAVPSPTQSGLVANCQGFYLAVQGDTCDTIISSLGYLTMNQFKTWNPALGADCSGLIVGDYYCISNSTCLPLPSVATKPPSPVQTGIVSSCTMWYQATPGDDCSLIPQFFMNSFTSQDLISWNPALKSDCSGIIPGDYYCVATPNKSPPSCKTATTSTTPQPTNGNGPQPQQPGIISSCTKYWFVGATDDCNSIASANNITTSTLGAWNPAIGVSCTGLKPDYYICVGGPVDTGSLSSTAPGSSTTKSNVPTTASTAVGTTSPPSTTSKSSSSTSSITSAIPSSTITTTSSANTISTPSPAQTGMVAGCGRFYKVRTGDTCFDIAQAADISLDIFYSWNPAVNQCAGLQANVFVCIGLGGPLFTTITTGSPTPATPTPHQTSMVTNCLRFYDVHSGDLCSGIASKAGINTSAFYAMNPAVHTDCSGLQASVYVCIGTTGPATTITGTLPALATGV